MPLLFEFLEQFVFGNFLITLTQLEKTESIGKVYYYFEKRTRSHFFCAISTFVFGGYYLRNFQEMNFNWYISKVHIYLSAFINALICMNAHL